MPSLKCVTAEENAELVIGFHKSTRGEFPEFLYHGAVAIGLAGELYQSFNEYQYILIDSSDNHPVALGNCFPLFWNGPIEGLPDGGFEWALQTAVEQARAGIKPNLLCAFQIIVPNALQGKGLSTEAVTSMVNIARKRQLAGLIAPVRPNRKAPYPRMTMEQYVAWKRDDGLPFDDWIRVHVRLGADLIGVCNRSFIVEGNVADWENWTGLNFTSSGKYDIPGGLVPVEIDIETNHGVYVEPNVWMHHRI